jgi:hypothetical protein
MFFCSLELRIALQLSRKTAQPGVVVSPKGWSRGWHIIAKFNQPVSKTTGQDVD